MMACGQVSSALCDQVLTYCGMLDMAPHGCILTEWVEGRSADQEAGVYCIVRAGTKTKMRSILRLLINNKHS